MHLAPRRERFDEPPFGSCQILESVGEHGCPVPGPEVGREPLDGASPHHAAVAHPEPLQLGSVDPGESRELRAKILGIEQAGLELGQCPGERVREARKPGGWPERLERRRADDVPQHDGALGIAQCPRRRAATGKKGEERVERPDGAGEQRSAATRKLSFDAVDIEAIRDDQPRIAVECVGEPVEQERDLAGVRRADDE